MSDRNLRLDNMMGNDPCSCAKPDFHLSDCMKCGKHEPPPFDSDLNHAMEVLRWLMAQQPKDSPREWDYAIHRHGVEIEAATFAEAPHDRPVHRRRDP